MYSLAEITRVLGQEAAAKLSANAKPTELFIPATRSPWVTMTTPPSTPLSLLVLSRELSNPALDRLKNLPPGISVTISGKPAELIAAAKARPTDDVAVLAWVTGRDELRDVVVGTEGRVRWVHSAMAGVNNILSKELVESPLAMTNARGAFSPSLGEWAVLSAMYFAKAVDAMGRAQREGRWEQVYVEEMRAKVMGIVGFGDIGRHAAIRAKALGMVVKAIRSHPDRPPFPDPLIVDEVLPPTSLLSLIPQCDFLLCALPLTPLTHHLIAAPHLAAMKPSAVIINVGRGPTVDEAALIDVLTRRAIRGAALDVFDTEPLPPGHPFYSLPNVLLSAHCADRTPDYWHLTMDGFLSNLERYVTGVPLANHVVKERGY